VASAYGWVTIVILSMVKQAHPSYSNTNHVFFTTSLKPSGQGRTPLTSRMLPPSSRMVSFDWNNIVEPLLPAYASFQIRVEFYSYNIY
jgi:hypothetical protein